MSSEDGVADAASRHESISGGLISRVLSPQPVSRRTSAAAAAIRLGGALLRRSSSQPGPLGAKRSCLPEQARGPYLALLRVGFAMRTLLPAAPVRFYRTLSPLPVTVRSIGGILSVALSLGHDFYACPGGRYPPPLLRGARTFLGIASDNAAATGPLTRAPINRLRSVGKPNAPRRGRGRGGAGTGSRRFADPPDRRSVRDASAAGTPRPPFRDR